MTAQTKWDKLDVELSDTNESERARETKVPCLYCGTPTKALSGVCTAHDDLPEQEAESLADDLLKRIRVSKEEE